MSVFGTINGILTRVGLAYLFCVYWEWGLWGIFMSKNLEFGIRIAVFLGFIVAKDLESIEGVE